MSFGITSSRKVVAAAGTAVTLVSAKARVHEVIITAETDNTGIIAVGGSSTIATALTQQGALLLAGESLPPLFDVDLYEIYIDASVSGDGVSFMYLS